MYAVSAVIVSTLAGLVVLLVYGGAYSVALLYGASVGILSFVSTAFTVSLLTGRSTPVGVMIGGASFAARMGFAAVALGVPAYLDSWPVVVMMAGFAAVYVAENVLLVPVLFGKRSASVRAGYPVGEGVERRTEI